MICESIHLPILFGNTKLGLAWLWYATYFIIFFPIRWCSPFISPDPTLPQILEKSKVNFKQASLCPGSPHPKFRMAVYCHPFPLDCEAMELGRGEGFKVGRKLLLRGNIGTHRIALM